MALLACLLVGGCVERTLTITSEPSGAIVYISHVEKGRTPLTIPFLWYNDYDIELRREGGYETLKTHACLNVPPYEVPPVDLLSELAPWTYKDNRYLHFTLCKAAEPTDQEMIERAQRFREMTGGATSQPATEPAP